MFERLSRPRATPQWIAQTPNSGGKDICREMAAPTTSGEARVKRLARYLEEFPRLALD